MDNLLICERCAHGAPLHETSGCSSARCECRLSSSIIVEETLRGVGHEMRLAWLPASAKKTKLS